MHFLLLLADQSLMASAGEVAPGSAGALEPVLKPHTLSPQLPIPQVPTESTTT